jgi:putative transcriptional regulator
MKMTKSTMQLKISNRLHVIRAEHKITQDQLAKEIGVTRATIVAIEGGGYNPSLELAFRLARYFKTDINEIFSVEEDTNEEN